MYALVGENVKAKIRKGARCKLCNKIIKAREDKEEKNKHDRKKWPRKKDSRCTNRGGY